MAQTIGDILINVKADTQELVKGFNRAEKTVNKTTKDMKNSIIGLTTAYISLTGAIDLGKSFIRQADSMNMVSSRLKLVTKDSEDLIKVQKELFEISQNARTGYASTSDLFARVSRSAKEYNIEQEKILSVTDSISKALIISGESASSSQAALIQLGQAFSSDFQAVGQELSSLKEQAPRLYQMMVDGLGVTRAEFKKLAEDGELSTQIIIESLTKSAESVNIEFSQMVKTVDQAMIQASNSTQKLIAEIDKTFNITTKISDGFTDLSKSIDGISAEDVEKFIEFAKALGLMGASYIALNTSIKAYDTAAKIAIATNTVLGGSYGAVNRAILLTAASQKALNIAFKASAIGLATVAVAAIAKSFTEASERAESFAFSINKVNSELSLVPFRERLISVTKELSDMDKRFKGYNTTQKQMYAGAYNLLFREKQILEENIKLIEKKNDANKPKDPDAGGEDEETFLEKQIKLTESLIKVDELSQRLKEDALKEDEKKLRVMEKLQEAYQNSFTLQEDLFNLQQQGSTQSADTQDENEIAKIQAALDMIQAPADAINEKFLSMFDAIDGIFDESQMKDFFKEWNKELDGINKESSKYEGIGSKDWTSGLSGQAKEIANIGNAIADLGKEQEKFAKYTKKNGENEDATNKHLENQIGLYGNIAGAVSNMAEEGSTAAKVAQVAQAALAVAQGAVAIINQGSGDPYTAIPRMIAMAATVASVLGNAGIGGGGSISAVDAGVTQQSEFTSALTELTMQPMLDKLDRQIELLEIIGLEGTAGRTRLSQAGLQFDLDTKLLAEEIIRSTQTITVTEGVGGASGVLADWNNRFTQINETVGDGLFSLDEANESIRFNADVFRENTLASLSAIYQFDLLNVLSNWQDAAKEGATTWEQFAAFAKAQGISNINELQEITHDYILTLSDVVEGMTDAKDSFKDFYDELTQTGFYGARDLQKAQEDILKLTNSGNFADYLSKQVEAIEKVESRFNTDITELFLSTNPDDLQKQADALAELNMVMDNAFGDGVQSALDYLDSIDLVAEAMITSRENINSFIDGFKTQEQLAQDLASTLDVKLATSMDGLISLFGELQSGIGGLTDSELELLEANKSLIEETSNTTELIDSLSGALTSIQSTIENLRGASIGTSFALNSFYESMRDTLALSGSGNTDAFVESLNETIGFSSVLLNKDAFTNQRDMLFAQSVAANQFESLESSTLEQIDYLRLIEENTREQLDAFISVAQTMGADISSSLSSISTGTPTQQIFQSVMGRDIASAEGLAWATDIYNSLGATALVDALKLSSEFQAQSFEVGTPNVPYDMMANIHRGEMIIPPTFSNGIRNGDVTLGMNGNMEEKLNILIDQNQQLIEINRDIETNTTESRIVS